MCACQAMTLATLPEALWPVQEAANKLASLRAKAVKARVLIPFPFIELVGVACRAPLRIGLVWHCICGKAEFLPSWSSDTVPVETQDKKAKGKDKLDIVRWCAAFQAYALAADAADVMCLFLCWAPLRVSCACMCVPGQVWKYSSAIAHMNVCLEIASKAASEKRRHSLAILYDELCRKEWCVKASRGRHYCLRTPVASYLSCFPACA